MSVRPQVVVIGAGAAGLLAAAVAASHGSEVTIVERNRQAGRKLLLSGKGRCNVTHDGPASALVDGIPGNGRFLFSAFHRFGSGELRTHLAALGVATKVERGRRVFPETDKAASVRDALVADCLRAGCRFRYGERVTEIVTQTTDSGLPRASGVRTQSGLQISADAIVVATGGKSYPGTGSTGDGYALVSRLGHRVTRLVPSLVPLCSAESWPRELSGLSLRNVGLSASWQPGPRQESVTVSEAGLADEFGEMLFTHFGISGPIVLRASRAVAFALAEGVHEVRLKVDLKPALASETLDQRLQRDLVSRSNREVRNALADLAPTALVGQLLVLSEIDPLKRAREVTRAERHQLGALVKGMPLTITGTRGFGEAIVTAGGVDVREVSPQTMASRLVRGLYLAGEVLDVDGYTGGYNLQAAFSTGWVAGRAAALAGNGPLS